MKIRKLKELRKIKGVSQTQCSNETGIPIKTIKRYDQGGEVGKVDYANILAHYFNISLDELLED